MKEAVNVISKVRIRKFYECEQDKEHIKRNKTKYGDHPFDDEEDKKI